MRMSQISPQLDDCPHSRSTTQQEAGGELVTAEASELAADLDVSAAVADGGGEEGDAEGGQLEVGEGADAGEVELEAVLEDGDADPVDGTCVEDMAAPGATVPEGELDAEGPGVEEADAEEEAYGEGAGSAEVVGEDEVAVAEEGEAVLTQDGPGVSGGGEEEEIDAVEELGDELLGEEEIGQEAAEEEVADASVEDDGLVGGDA